MQQVGVWHIATKGPQKLSESKINLEKELEEWIEQDPNLLETGLAIVGRQMRLDSGADVNAFVKGLDRLFKRIEEKAK